MFTERCSSPQQLAQPSASSFLDQKSLTFARQLEGNTVNLVTELPITTPAPLWSLLLFCIHFAHALWYGHLYPYQVYDTDLFAYFIYFRNWLDHNQILHSATFFPVPKPLLVFLLGPLANPWFAFSVSAFAAAGLGSVIYIVARNAFGHLPALLFSLFFLLDPFKGILALRSSAELYLCLFFFLSLYLASRDQYGLSSVCIALSALVKPVTLPSAFFFLLPPQLSRTKRWVYIGMALFALPLTFLVLHEVAGGTTSSERFFSEFTAMRNTAAVTPDQVVSFVFWTQLVKTRFPLSAPFGFLGIIMWLAADRKRLTSPLLLFPLGFLAGYLTLSIMSPYSPFFRFFWPIEIWFLAFLVYGIVEGVRRITFGQATQHKVVMGFLFFFLLDDSLQYYFRYRNKFILPFESGMAFVQRSLEFLKRERQGHESVMTSLAFVPPVMWTLNSYDRTDIVLSVEEKATKGENVQPDWIIYVPTISANLQTNEWLEQLIRNGHYQLQLQEGTSALLRHSSPRPAPSTPG
jgi:hypothetical protein